MIKTLCGIPALVLALVCGCAPRLTSRSVTHGELSPRIEHWLAVTGIGTPVREHRVLRSGDRWTLRMALTLPQECTSETCDQYFVFAPGRERVIELIDELAGATDTTREQWSLWLDASCHRLQLSWGPSGELTESPPQRTCKGAHPPPIELGCPNPGQRTGTQWLDAVKAQVELRFQHSEVGEASRDDNRIMLIVRTPKEHADVVPGFWETIEISGVLSGGKECRTLYLTIDGRHAKGAREPATDQFRDLQAEHSREFDAFVDDFRGRLSRALTPGGQR